VQVSYYEAGHMMYIERQGRERMALELRAFVRRAAGKD
jgi:carboxypeptidase C (cathepsin A)